MRIVVLDFETYWDSKNYTLSKIGPISYIRDSRFSAQLMSYIVTDASTMTYDRVRVAEHDNIPARGDCCPQWEWVRFPYSLGDLPCGSEDCHRYHVHGTVDRGITNPE